MTMPGMIADEMPVDAASDAPEVTDAERAQVRRFLFDTKAPAWLEAAFARWKRDREYLHTEVFAADDDSKLTVNTILRSIYAKLGQVWPENPEAVVKPADEVEPLPDDPMRPAWEVYRDLLEQTGKTAAVLNRKWANEASMLPVFRTGALKTFTTGLAWLKTGWMEDPSRGALGVAMRHAGDSRDQVLKLRRLAREFEDGVFEDGCADYQELLDLSQWMRDQAAERVRQVPPGDPREARLLAILHAPPGPLPLAVQPEPDVWQAPMVDVVEPEDVRWDWNRVPSPGLCHRGRRWSQRVWMHRDEVATRYKITEEEKRKLGQVSEWLGRTSTARDPLIFGASQAQDPVKDIDLEAQVRADGSEVAVWERWDLEQGMVYWFCAGIDRMLDKQRIDTATRRGHPFIPLFWNEVDGRFDPVSDVQFGRKAQDNLNQTLTDDWEARIASYPFYAIAAGMLTPEDKAAIETGRRAHKVVELSRNPEDVAKAMASIKGEEYHPERYQIAITQMNALIERMVGAPMEAQGGQGKPEFASQLMIMQQSMNAASNRVARLILEAMRQVFEDWTDYAFVALSQKQAQLRAGQFAVWPVARREEIRAGLVVEVVSAGVRGVRRADLEDLGTAAQVVGAWLANAQQAALMGYEVPLDQIAQRVAAALDLRVSGGVLRKMRMAGMLPGMPGPGMPMGPGGPGMPGAPVDPLNPPVEQLNPAAAAVVRGR